MMPGLLDAGLRVLVPDLVGMGRSDKPSEKSDYTFARHVAWARSWVEQVDVQGGIYFGQDWGSVIGLTIVTQEADRFAAITLGNGGLFRSGRRTTGPLKPRVTSTSTLTAQPSRLTGTLGGPRYKQASSWTSAWQSARKWTSCMQSSLVPATRGNKRPMTHSGGRATPSSRTRMGKPSAS